MALVSFTLSEEGVGAFNDALLVLTALNLTKSAYASFTFAASRFFSRFSFEGNAQYRERFYCGDPTRDRDNVTTIERCEVSIDDGPGKKSRFIAKIFCRNGITATHRLSFESKAPVHAKFDKNEAIYHWTINSRTLRSLMEHFGPGIDLLDINTDGDSVVNFTCFTEKQVSINNEGKSVLKKPLHTSIAVEMDEFDDIDVAEKLHIIISVRDIRAILQHANWTSSELNAAYSRPGRPMKISYDGDGIICEFILMTVDEKGTAAQKKGQSKVAAKTTRLAANAASNIAAADASNHARQPSPKEKQAQQASMPPPARRSAAPRSSQFDIRAPLAQPPSTLKSDSLFLPQPDEDEQWEPVNPDEDDEEGENPRLEWGASNEPDPSTMRISNHFNTSQNNPLGGAGNGMPSFLEPTQRVSDVRKFGLFGS
ncbi:DNA repair protein rad9 [Cytospora mali]|uniref:DNA repair protein rad9 n=1 Tax=Cytospora mali TaxID=578113 RepID=A0A194VN13_CYTMA|nr:DNA repair protein rad9 [Valsa mali]